MKKYHGFRSWRAMPAHDGFPTRRHGSDTMIPHLSQWFFKYLVSYKLT
ncbi:hypothetical protein [Moraxella lacunata]|nr:hypothetical protein [Moraxella lacunata]